jgi:hypothetical protein
MAGLASNAAARAVERSVWVRVRLTKDIVTSLKVVSEQGNWYIETPLKLQELGLEKMLLARKKHPAVASAISSPGK